MNQTRRTHHRNTRIVVSALPDERTEDGMGWKYCYMSETRLAEAKVPRILVTRFEGADADQEVAELFRGSLLSQYGRSLSPEQLSYVLAKAAEEPTALWFTLAAKIASSWTMGLPVTGGGNAVPSTRSQCFVQGTVRGIILQLVDNWKTSFGPKLLHYAIGFITFSRAGINAYICHIYNVLNTSC